jgi:histidinol dehydrogenase
MNALPARIAGVPDIVMTVPTPDGAKNPLMLAAAHLAGVTRAFAVGGAQAIAALAYGTATIPAVDKIVGPGNAYVAAAKRRVFGTVGIDMIAGPSEILVIADASANPDWVAMDLFAQAERDEAAQAICSRPTARSSMLSRRHRTPAPGDAAQRHHRRSVGTARRFDAHEGSGRSLLIADRIAPEPWSLRSPNPKPCCRSSQRRRDLLDTTARSDQGLLRRPDHVFRRRAAHAFTPLGADFETQQRDRRVEAGAPVLKHIRDALARGEGLTAHARSAGCRLGP